MTGRDASREFDRPWEALPRSRLLERPTPLLAAARLSERLGTEVWIKRDDYAPLGIAGNKIRKLELLLPEILEGGYETLVTVGAAQSNAARCTAAVAARAGLDCALLLLGDPPPANERTGNLLIDGLADAELHFTGAADWEGLARASEEFVQQLEREGRRPKLLPLGYSTPVGVAAFAAAFAELHDQCREAALLPTTLVHASTSGATHAGLVLGRSLLKSPVRVVGVDAARVYGERTEATLDGMIAAGAAALGTDRPAGAHTDLRFDFIGPGYAKPSEESIAALREIASLEGILVDPVYSSKALAGLISMVRARQIGGPVVFWHTGGVPALFAPAYQRLLA